MKCPSQQSVDLSSLEDPSELDNITGENLVEILKEKDVSFFVLNTSWEKTLILFS